MTSDYLWDRSGPADPEIEALERTLSSLSLRALGQPPAAAERRSRSVASYALAAAAALAIGAGGYWLGRAQGARVSVSPDTPPAKAPAVAGGCPPCPKAAPEQSSSATPSRREHGAHLLDPWKHSAPKAPKRKSKLVDPWKHRAPPAPPRRKAQLLDPWGDSSAEPRSTAPRHRLSSSDVQRVVTAHTAGIRSACWLPALAARASDAPDTARVGVAMVIGPDGHVSSASSSGSPRGYPGLDTCIVRQARKWRFPKTGVRTRVNVPFVFSASGGSGHTVSPW